MYRTTFQHDSKGFVSQQMAATHICFSPAFVTVHPMSSQLFAEGTCLLKFGRAETLTLRHFSVNFQVLVR